MIVALPRPFSYHFFFQEKSKAAGHRHHRKRRRYDDESFLSESSTSSDSDKGSNSDSVALESKKSTKYEDLGTSSPPQGNGDAGKWDKERSY